MRLAAFILAPLLTAAAAGAAPATVPSTAPATAPTTAPAPVDPAVERLAAGVAALSLSSDQRASVDAIMAHLRAKTIAARAAADTESARDTSRQVMADARARLAAALTPAQRQALRDQLHRRPPAEPPAATPRPPPAAGPALARQPAPPPVAPPPAAAARPLSVGDAAPEFALTSTDDRAIRLSAYRGRVVVIVFGSLSSPHFRQRAAALEQLRREYDVRAQFVVVYAAEAHPEDGWQVERNRAEDVRVAQPPDAAARAAVAKQAKARLRLSWPVAVDAMDNATAGAYAAGGNAAFVINRDGTVAAVQQWCDPDGLRRHIDAATARAGK